MESIMSWVISALSGHVSREMIVFIICAEHQYYQSTVDLHYRKYYSGSVHPVADHTDL